MGRFSITVHFLPANVSFRGALLGFQLLAWLINSQKDNCSREIGGVVSQICL